MKRIIKWCLKLIPDKLYIKLIYIIRFRKKINLKNPKTFNEKLNYLKLYNRIKKYSVLADKYLVKDYVKEKIGEEYVIKTYKIWNNADDIDITDLPNRFVLKCNHDSSGAIICKDKTKFNVELYKKELNKNLKRNYFYPLREWPYKNIKPVIIAEEYIEDPTSEDLRDYKFLCFNGKPKYVYVTVKNDNIYENYYDLEFNIVNIDHGFPRNSFEFKKPKNFEKMIEIAEILSENIPFVRIDLHNIEGKIYFGEFTFYDWGGMRPYKNQSDDIELGNLIELPKKLKD